MTRPIRLTVCLTHPIQYYSPWFRFIEEREPGIELTVLYASEPTPSQQGVGFGREFMWDQALREGYRSRVLRAANEGNYFGSDSLFGVDAPGIGTAIADTEADVVLLPGWHSIAQARAILACQLRAVPMLYRGDSHLAGRDNGNKLCLWRARTGWLLRRFDGYLSVGSRVREYFRFFGIEESRVFDAPHAVDNDFFAEHASPFQQPKARARARGEIGIELGEFVVLFVGKLEEKKHPDDLLRACALMDKPPTVLVVGTGDLEERCRVLARDANLRVCWQGFLNQSDLGRAYGIADCLVLPSDWGETWGLVVNEAMATGLACVVSDRVGCAPDLVEEDRTGAVFPFGNVTALAHTLERVRDGRKQGGFEPEWCRRAAGRHSFTRATQGLIEGCRAVSHHIN